MARTVRGNSLGTVVRLKAVSQIRGFHCSPNVCHVDKRVGSSGLKGPDVVVVDDDVEVEVRMNEGPPGVRNRFSLEASRRTKYTSVKLHHLQVNVRY